MDPLLPEQLTRTVRHRLGRLFALKYFVQLLTVWFFLWGTAVLMLRAGLGAPVGPLIWGFLVVLPLLGTAIIWATRELPPNRAIMAMLDYQSAHGGLLMAGEEATLGKWRYRLHDVSPLSFSWDSRQVFMPFLLATVFVGTAFLIPQQFFKNERVSRPLEIGGEIKRLNSMIEAMKEQEVIDAGKADKLEEKLKDLQKEAKSEKPGQTLEALDHLEDMTGKAARKAAEDMVKMTEMLTRSESLLDSMGGGGKPMDRKAQAEAEKKLDEILQKASSTLQLGKKDKAREEFEESLKKTKEALKNGTATTQHLKDLAMKMKGLQQKGLDKMEKMKGLTALDEKSRKMLEQALKSGKLKLKDAKDLKGMKIAKEVKNLKFGPGKPGGKTGSEAIAIAVAVEGGEGGKPGEEGGEGNSSQNGDGEPGSGGVSRGRGDAPMTLGDKTDENGMKFKEEVLPPSQSVRPEDVQLIGTSEEAPELSHDGVQPGAGVGNSSGNSGGSANRTVVLPRHQQAIKRYFQRK